MVCLLGGAAMACSGGSNDSGSHSDDVTGKYSYLLEMEDFFARSRTGAPVTCDWKQGLGACVAAIRANEAMEKKTRVEIHPSDYEL